MVSLKSQTGLLFSKGPSAVPLNVGECTIWSLYVSCGMSHFFLVAFEKLSPKTTIKDRAGINIQEKSTLIYPEPWASFVKVTSFSLSFPQFMCYSFVFCSFSQFLEKEKKKDKKSNYDLLNVLLTTPQHTTHHFFKMKDFSNRNLGQRVVRDNLKGDLGNGSEQAAGSKEGRTLQRLLSHALVRSMTFRLSEVSAWGFQSRGVSLTCKTDALSKKAASWQP